MATAVIAALLVSCHRPAAVLDKELTTLGSGEVTAKLLELPGAFPPNDLYNYGYVMKYRVLKTHRGRVEGDEIFVTHYNPLKPRSSVQDDISGKIGGRVREFHVGDVHHMALEAPADQYWMGGIVDRYQDSKAVRYWAVWTNPD